MVEMVLERIRIVLQMYLECLITWKITIQGTSDYVQWSREGENGKSDYFKTLVFFKVLSLFVRTISFCKHSM